MIEPIAVGLMRAQQTKCDSSFGREGVPAQYPGPRRFEEERRAALRPKRLRESGSV
jgi:hypothetical protein